MPLRVGPPTTLVLTLPSDPSLARLTRLVALHFMRQNGLRVRAARRSARMVERRCLGLLRSASRSHSTRGGRPFTLVLTAGARFLEVAARPAPAGRGSRWLARIPRPAVP